MRKMRRAVFANCTEKQNYDFFVRKAHQNFASGEKAFLTPLAPQRRPKPMPTENYNHQAIR